MADGNGGNWVVSPVVRLLSGAIVKSNSNNNDKLLSIAGNNVLPDSPLRESLSSISGSISLACWIVLLLPQLIEQWRTKSGEGVSLLFLGAWFVGDIFNLTGSLWAGLLPEVIGLAVWFCFADILMLSSVIYYRVQARRSQQRRSSNVDDEEDPNRPLLSRSTSDANDLPSSGVGTSAQAAASNGEGNTLNPHLPHHHHHHHHQHQQHGSHHENGIWEEVGLPYERRRRSSGSDGSRRGSKSMRRTSWRRDSLSQIVEDPGRGFHRVLIDYLLPLLFVIVAGVAGFFISRSQRHEPSQQPGDGGNNGSEMSRGPQVLGYLSAIMYLGARIPQIIQNYQKKSVRGLSLLFFMYSTLGNITYGAQILFYSTTKSYILLNLSWLLGSLGTIAEDTVIFTQFFLYEHDEDMDDNDELLQEEVL